jgi:hypothetical protein
MNEALLRELAETIAREQFFVQWPFYVLILALSMVANFVAALAGAYARKRGENYATKADFADLLSQLRTTTLAVEEIRTTFTHADWVNRETKTLRKLKLEQLLRAVHEVCQWEEDYADVEVWRHTHKTLGPSPLPKLKILVALFLPELRGQVEQFISHHQKTIVLMVKTQQEIQFAKDANAVAPEAGPVAEFEKAWPPLILVQDSLIRNIEQRCFELMQELLHGETKQAS